MREVLTVSHREPRLTLHRRERADWSVVEAGPGSSAALASVAATIAVDEPYEGLEYA